MAVLPVTLCLSGVMLITSTNRGISAQLKRMNFSCKQLSDNNGISNCRQAGLCRSAQLERAALRGLWQANTSMNHSASMEQKAMQSAMSDFGWAYCPTAACAGALFRCPALPKLRQESTQCGVHLLTAPELPKRLSAHSIAATNAVCAWTSDRFSVVYLNFDCIFLVCLFCSAQANRRSRFAKHSCMLLLSLRLIPAGIDRKLHNLFRHSTKVVQHRRSAVLYEEAMAEFAATAGRAPNRGQFLAQESTLCSVKAHVHRAARCSALAAQA
eukprot:1808-Heterococcus_DN1.PRE.1